MVSSNQSAFIPSRAIQENIMLTHKMVRGYGRKHREKRAAIKIDIQSAYDLVNCHSLMLLLVNMDIPNPMRKWIYMCVSSPTTPLLLTGKSRDTLKEKRIETRGPLIPNSSHSCYGSSITIIAYWCKREQAHLSYQVLQNEAHSYLFGR